MVLDDDIKRIIEDPNIDWEQFENAKILVTGATGLIGSLCIKALRALDFPVNIYALVRDRSKAETIFGDSINYIVGDVKEPIECDEEMDYVIHCAAITKSKMMIEAPVDTLEISIAGTMNVLRYAVVSKAKAMVYVSSMEAYGVTDEALNPYTEDKLGFVDLTSARSSYPEGKRASECFCSAFFHQYGLPVRTARLALTMGPGIPVSDNRVSMQFAKSALNGTDIVLHTEGRSVSNFCYTSDCIRGIFTILLRGKNGEIYNVCNDSETRMIRDIAQLVADKIAGGDIRVLYDIPERNTFGYAPDVTLRLSSEKLKGLGWNPEIGMEEAYRRLIMYIKGK